MTRTLLFPGILFAVLFGTAVSSSAREDLFYRDARMIGMGGAGTVSARGGVGFVNNPALLARARTGSFSFPILPLMVNRGFRDTAEFIVDNSDKFRNFDMLSLEERAEFLADAAELDGKRARMNAAPLIAVAVPVGLVSAGFAVYSIDDAMLRVDRGIFEPRVWGEGSLNTLAVFGVAGTMDLIEVSLHTGVNLKFIDRRAAPLFQIQATDLENLGEAIRPILNRASDERESHVAADIGTILSLPATGAEFGVSLRNLGYAPQSSVDLGGIWRLPTTPLILAADIRDILDNNEENFFRKVHLGGEFDFGMLELRAGLGSGYPAFGVGLDFGLFSVAGAYYTEELTGAPGGDGEDRFVAQVWFGR